MSEKELNGYRRTLDEIDRAMTELFGRRMETVRAIARLKREAGLPLFCPEREEEILTDRPASLPEDLRPYARALLLSELDLSRQYQEVLGGAGSGTAICLPPTAVSVKRGGLSDVGSFFSLDRRVLIVTDDGVPAAYAETVRQAAGAVGGQSVTVTLPSGETVKSPDVWLSLLRRMAECDFSRRDCVVAVGGGTVCDAAGFAASCYMRGIDCYLLPTTLLAQADASVGGKTALDLDGTKNLIGAFAPPRAVLIDPALTVTLSPRHLTCGMAEILKIALTASSDLFEALEAFDSVSAVADAAANGRLDPILTAAIRLKAQAVSVDPRDHGRRRMLNFGHTLGHALELTCQDLSHGEAVALGMIPFCAPAVRKRLIPRLRALGLPVTVSCDPAAVSAVLRHDKKGSDGRVTVIRTDAVGSWRTDSLTHDEILAGLSLIRQSDPDKGADDR